MRFLVPVLLFYTTLSSARQLQGTIANSETGEPLQKVWVHSLVSGVNAFSDPSGRKIKKTLQDDTARCSPDLCWFIQAILSLPVFLF